MRSLRRHVLRQTVEVCGGDRRMFTCEVGSCLSTSFVFDQQNFHRKTLRRIYGVVQLQRRILNSKCAVSDWEILLKIEKIKRWAELADQKHVRTPSPLARQLALTAFKLQMFGGKTRHVWHPIRTCFFLTCLRLTATSPLHRSSHPFLLTVTTPPLGTPKNVCMGGDPATTPPPPFTSLFVSSALKWYKQRFWNSLTNAKSPWPTELKISQ